MYCGVSIANNVNWQQSKKEWGSGCPTTGGNSGFDFFGQCSCHVEILKVSENLWLL
jgi:hypothetical protein